MPERVAVWHMPICVFFLSVYGLDNHLNHRVKILLDLNIIVPFEVLPALKFCRRNLAPVAHISISILALQYLQPCVLN